MKTINGQKVPKTKKKRILNKYIPKGIYCHGNDLKNVCPFWNCRLATIKDLNNIYIKNNGIINNEKMTLEQAIEYMQNTEESEFFTNVCECKKIGYTEYCQESLLWDQCKECGANYGNLKYEIMKFSIPNKIRKSSKKNKEKWLKETYKWL